LSGQDLHWNRPPPAITIEEILVALNYQHLARGSLFNASRRLLFINTVPASREERTALNS